MKIILSLSIFLIAIPLKFCTSSNIGYSTHNIANQDSINYKVYKIDSVNNYYLIYAKKGDSLFKIISKKEPSIKCSGIKVDKIYRFYLHSMLSVNGHSIIPANEIYELSGWRIDDSTTVKFEGDSIRDLYIADNVKGLCLQ